MTLLKCTKISEPKIARLTAHSFLILDFTALLSRGFLSPQKNTAETA